MLVKGDFQFYIKCWFPVLYSKHKWFLYSCSYKLFYIDYISCLFILVREIHSSPLQTIYIHVVLLRELAEHFWLILAFSSLTFKLRSKMIYLIRLRMWVMLSSKDSKWLSYTSEIRLVDSNFSNVTCMRSCF